MILYNFVIVMLSMTFSILVAAFKLFFFDSKVKRRTVKKRTVKRDSKDGPSC